METGEIIKVADVTTNGFVTDSMMQIVQNGNEESLSFVFIGKNDKEIEKYTIRKELVDLCLLWLYLFYIWSLLTYFF